MTVSSTERVRRCGPRSSRIDCSQAARCGPSSSRPGDPAVHPVERAERLADDDHPDREAEEDEQVRAEARPRRLGQRGREPDQPEREPDPHHDRAQRHEQHEHERDRAPQQPLAARARAPARRRGGGHGHADGDTRHSGRTHTIGCTHNQGTGSDPRPPVARTTGDTGSDALTPIVLGMRLSVLDQSPISAGSTGPDALAQHARPRPPRRRARLPPLLGRRAPRRRDARRPRPRGADRPDRRGHPPDPRRQRRRDAPALLAAEGRRGLQPARRPLSRAGSTSASAARRAPTR